MIKRQGLTLLIFSVCFIATFLLIEKEVSQMRARNRHRQASWDWRNTLQEKVTREMRPLGNDNFVVISERGYNFGKESIPGSGLKLKPRSQLNDNTISKFVFDKSEYLRTRKSSSEEPWFYIWVLNPATQDEKFRYISPSGYYNYDYTLGLRGPRNWNNDYQGYSLMLGEFPKVEYGNSDPDAYKWFVDSWDGGNRIRNRKYSSKCIDVYGNKYQDNGNVAFYDCHSSINQKFF